MIHENTMVETKTFEAQTADEITAEYNLPDYLPDINRLLKTDALVTEYSHELLGDRLAYDGKLLCRILYATSDGTLRHAEFEREFSSETAVSGTQGDCDIRFEAHMGAVLCRLQNPRKLTAKMKLILLTSVFCAENIAPASETKLTPEEEASPEEKKRSIACLSCMSVTEKPVPVSEDIELDASLPAISEIVSAELTPYITDIRTGDGKLVYKGEITADLLYLAEKADDCPEGEAPKYLCFSAKIPIAGEIEAPHVTEKYIPFAFCHVSSPEFRPQTNSFGENRTAELDFEYHLSVSLFGNTEATLTEDIYSTEYETVTQTKSLAYDSVLCARSFNFTSDGTVTTDDPDFDRVVLTSADATILRTERAGNKLIFIGTASVSAILTNGEGVYLTKSFELPIRGETDVPALSELYEVRSLPTVIGALARPEEGTLSVTLETLVSCVLFEKHREDYISSFSLCKDRPVTSPEEASLLLCYPAHGDTLWDIAKKYKTTTADIMEMNGISAETSPRVIMIPRKKSFAAKGKRIL